MTYIHLVFNCSSISGSATCPDIGSGSLHYELHWEFRPEAVFTSVSKTSSILAGSTTFRAARALAPSNSITRLSVSISEMATSYRLYTGSSSKFSKTGVESVFAIAGIESLENCGIRLD